MNNEDSPCLRAAEQNAVQKNNKKKKKNTRKKGGKPSKGRPQNAKPKKVEKDSEKVEKDSEKVEKDSDALPSSMAEYILRAYKRQEAEERYITKKKSVSSGAQSVPVLKKTQREMLEIFFSGKTKSWHTYTWNDLANTVKRLGGRTSAKNSGEFVLNGVRFLMHYIHSDGHRVYPALVRDFFLPGLKRAGIITLGGDGKYKINAKYIR